MSETITSNGLLKYDDEVSNYTRHTHNEFDLERRISNDTHFCVQPDCIIIFEDIYKFFLYSQIIN